MLKYLVWCYFLEISGEAIEGCLNQNNGSSFHENINANGFVGMRIQEKMPLKGNDSKLQVKKDMEYGIMRGLAKAMLKFLRQYKKELEVIVFPRKES